MVISSTCTSTILTPTYNGYSTHLISTSPKHSRTWEHSLSIHHTSWPVNVFLSKHSSVAFSIGTMITRDTAPRPATEPMFYGIGILPWIHVLIAVSHLSWPTGTRYDPAWPKIFPTSWRIRMAWSPRFLQRATVGRLWTQSITFLLAFSHGLPTRLFGSISVHLSHNSKAHTSADFHGHEQPRISWAYIGIMLRHILPTYSKDSTTSAHHRTWSDTASS